MPKNMPQHITKCGSKQSGFTIIEVLVATVVLLIGIVGVAKLVPFAINLNTVNRQDSTALVIAQREMDALTSQPLSATTFTSAQGLTCPAAGVCNLGNAPTNPPSLSGSPVVMINNRPYINYNAATVTGYNFIYSDPDNPGASYDIRWAVITYGAGGTTTGRRFIVGARNMGSNSPLLPVTLDSMVEK
jgi:prepilin-type N-terminal cleavage/methylation domain-containing protein